MIDVAHSVNLDQQRLDFPHDPILQQQYFVNTPTNFATTMSAQPLFNPNSASYGFDLTGEQSTEVAMPTLFDIQNWSAASFIAMTFHQQFPLPQFNQLSDQNLTNTTNSTQSHTSSTSNEMATATGFSNQQFSDVDTSAQQTSMLQPSPLETPPYVEPSINYPCYPTTSNASTSNNSMSLTNNLDDNLPVNTTTNNNYPPRSVYYMENNYHNCPTSRVGMTTPQLINYPIRQQGIIYQGSTPSSSIGRKITSGSIETNVPNVSNVPYPRPDNVTAATLPTSISSNLFTFNPSGNGLVPSFDLSSTIFSAKPTTAPTTIAIPSNSTGSAASSSENTSPTKKTYSYSGPPKSYYSRLPLYDRPFKCDTCPQSFNRNHDLKRHKRIHLAVKPYPCVYCDKQFSRKDALKRHILVKGCNNTAKKNNNNTSNKSADNDSLPNSSGQKYDSIECESPIKSEPTSNVHHNYL